MIINGRFLSLLTDYWYVHFESYDLQKRESVHVRHLHVGDHNIEIISVLPQHLQSFTSLRCSSNCTNPVQFFSQELNISRQYPTMNFSISSYRI